MWRLLTSLPPARIVQCIDFHHLRDAANGRQVAGMLESQASGLNADEAGLAEPGMIRERNANRIP